MHNFYDFIEQIPQKKIFAYGKPNFRGAFNRGRRMRGNYHNNKVLINPHFRGNVQIKHNGNTVRKGQ